MIEILNGFAMRLNFPSLGTIPVIQIGARTEGQILTLYPDMTSLPKILFRLLKSENGNYIQKGRYNTVAVYSG